MIDRRLALLERILARTVLDPVTGCQIWTGPTSGKKGRGAGYPKMSVDGVTVRVHRVVAVCHYGFLPSKRQIDHKCENRLCVAIYHLEPVTHLENQRRRARSARAKKQQKLKRAA